MLAAINVAYPAQVLTATQIQALINAIDAHTSGPAQKQTIKAVLARSNHPADVTLTNEAVMQLEAGIDARLTGVEITPPAAGMITFEQRCKLDSLLSDAGITDADKTSSAMLVLGINRPERRPRARTAATRSPRRARLLPIPVRSGQPDPARHSKAKWTAPRPARRCRAVPDLWIAPQGAPPSLY